MGERAYTKEELWIEKDASARIYGMLYLPIAPASQRLPLVIFAHELGVNHASGTHYARVLAENGYAALTFDFRGGSVHHNKSGGSILEMSVMTEAADVAAVVEAARSWDFVDSGKIVLLGGSQGGCASSIYALDNAEKIAALALIYPALHVFEALNELFDSLDEVPETFGLLGGRVTVGRIYAEDVWDYRLLEHIGGFAKPALIVHGSEDPVVPVEYARKAAAVMPDCELRIIDGAGHGFDRPAFECACGFILAFLRRTIG